MPIIPLPTDLSPQRAAMALKAIARFGDNIIPPSGLKSWHKAFTLDARGNLVFWFNTVRHDGKEDTHAILERHIIYGQDTIQQN